MSKWSKFVSVSVATLGASLLSVSSYADSTQLHPITWKGAKWEYLVEHPTDIQHIDTARFEEVLDTAGENGWELVGVTDYFHFYSFIFKRELLPEKVAAHHAWLRNVKAKRAADQAIQLQKTIIAHREKLAFEKKHADAIAKMDAELAQEVRLEQQALQLTQKELMVQDQLAKKEQAKLAYEAQVRAELAKEAAIKKQQ